MEWSGRHSRQLPISFIAEGSRFVRFRGAVWGLENSGEGITAMVELGLHIFDAHGSSLLEGAVQVRVACVERDIEEVCSQ